MNRLLFQVLLLVILTFSIFTACEKTPLDELQPPSLCINGKDGIPDFPYEPDSDVLSKFRREKGREPVYSPY